MESGATEEGGGGKWAADKRVKVAAEAAKTNARAQMKWKWVWSRNGGGRWAGSRGAVVSARHPPKTTNWVKRGWRRLHFLRIYHIQKWQNKSALIPGSAERIYKEK